MAKKRFYLVKKRNRRSEGKAIYYCRFRSPSGELLPWKSTGETSKASAENWWTPDHQYLCTVASARLSVFEQALTWWESLHRSERFDRWLAKRERPAAIFACNDTVGLKTATACRRLASPCPLTSPSWASTTKTSSASFPYPLSPASRWTSSASDGRLPRLWPLSWTGDQDERRWSSCLPGRSWSGNPRGPSPLGMSSWTGRWASSTRPQHSR